MPGRLRRNPDGRRDRCIEQGHREPPRGRWWRSSAAPRCPPSLTILKTLAGKVDQLIVGGGIANTFLLAAGKRIGESLAEPEMVREAHQVMDIMKARGAEVPCPPTSSSPTRYRRWHAPTVSRWTMSARTTASSISGRRARPSWPRSLPTQEPSSGTDRLAFRTRTVRRRHENDGLRHRSLGRHSRSQVGAIRWLRLRSSISPTTSATSPPAAGVPRVSRGKRHCPPSQLSRHGSQTEQSSLTRACP